jgi:aminopeptidase N
MRVTLLVALVVLTTVAAGPAPRRGAAAQWSMTRLDLDLVIDTSAQRLEGQAEIHLRLDDRRASSLTLTIGEASRIVAVTDGAGVTASIDSAGSEAVVAVGEHQAGDDVVLHVRFVNRGQSFQLVVSGQGALASWARGWYPVPADSGVRAPGTTRLHIPDGWYGLANGALVDSRSEDGMRVETWRSDAPVARSFVAGAYRVERRIVDGRQVAAYLLPGGTADPTTYAESIGKIIATLSPVFGPYPYEAYAIAEIPDGLVKWTGSSEQGFFMASGLGARVNLPLVAHELAHGWWGNHVQATDPAAQMTSEALAQLGAALAIEGIEGHDAAVEFLRFSRDGYSDQQCARGYFAMRAKGLDKPLMQLSGSMEDHQLSDAKGHWVYWMLRDRVGESLYATEFQALQREFAGRAMSLMDLRRAFVAAAPPSADLKVFFAEWLDRAGAPDLALSWQAAGTTEQPEVEITIKQRGAIYHLPVEVAVDAERDTVMRTIRLTRATETFRFPATSPLRAVRLDPGHRILRWQPEYERGVKGVAMQVLPRL